MEVELDLDLSEHVQRRFEQPNPDHVIGPFGPRAGLIDRHVCDPPPMDISAGGDHTEGSRSSLEPQHRARSHSILGQWRELAMGVSQCCWPASAVGSGGLYCDRGLPLLCWRDPGCPKDRPCTAARDRAALSQPAQLLHQGQVFHQRRRHQTVTVGPDLNHTARRDVEEVGRVRRSWSGR